VDQNTCFNIHVIVLVIPVSLECYRDAIPSVRVYVPETVSNNGDNALGKYVRLLVKVHVVLVWIVESAGLKSKEGSSAHGGEFLQLAETGQHFINILLGQSRILFWL
jgi:hypothetical protein